MGLDSVSFFGARAGNDETHGLPRYPKCRSMTAIDYNRALAATEGHEFTMDYMNYRDGE